MNTELFLNAVAISVVVTTVTKGSIFKGTRTFFPGLLNCPYCFAHWVSSLAALFLTSNLYDFIIITFALVALSSVFTFLLIIYLRWLDETIHDSTDSPLQ
jgi:hypothetical protein